MLLRFLLGGGLLLVAGCGSPAAPAQVAAAAEREVAGPAADAARSPNDLPPGGNSEGAVSLPLIDLEGRRHEGWKGEDTRAVALVFVLPDCPIANGILPELNRLHAEFAPRGIAFFLVQADSEVSAERARQHAREYEVQMPVLLDPQHQWVKRAGATTTPEAAVFDKQGRLVYRGRINDLYAGLGKRRRQPTKHDLREALESILAGKAIAEPRTTAVGCPIPPLP